MVNGTFPSVAMGLSTAVTMLELIIYLVPQVAPDLHFQPFKIDGSWKVSTSMFRSKRKAVNITRLPDLKVITAHYGKFEGDTMNTMYRVFCCDRWRHCFKANKQ